LISYGADVNAQDGNGKTPIFYATQNADFKITKLLLTNKADVKDNPELLNIAVKKECREIVQLLLEHGVDVNTGDEYGRTALHFTALGEDRFLLYKDPDINIKGEIAKLLLSWGANVNAQTKNGRTMLHAATQKGYLKVVEALLEYNADVNAKFKTNITPLHIASQKGHVEVVKFLLKFGACIGSKDEHGNTPLHIAVHKGHLEVLEVLLKFGAFIDSKDKYGNTPLHIAARKAYLDVVEVLLKFDADIDSQDEYGRTALHFASKEGCEQIVRALLEHGSDINIMSKNYETPLDFAGIRIFNIRADNYDYSDDYYYYFRGRGISACQIIAGILKRHIVKMKTANLYVSEKNLLASSSNDELSDFQKECEEEIESMLSEKVSNANVSFYDILTKSISQLAMYAGNESIVHIFRSVDYKVKFPIYASMINSNFKRGERRKKLLEHGNKIFHFLFNSFPRLPHDCTAKIFSYLSDENLRILIDACKPINCKRPNTDINSVLIT
jgi:ankyrin repeat protein